MGKINQFEDLEVWRNAINLGEKIYKLIDNNKIIREYSLKDQIKRATISISNNIAEGFEYDNTKEFIKFLKYSKGSAGEVRSMFYLMFRVQLIDNNTYLEFANELKSLSMQIKGFIKYLEDYNKKSKKQK